MASKKQTALFEDELKKLSFGTCGFEKTSVNSRPPQETITTRNGTCRLDLAWLVNCVLEWRVKIHSLSKWWSGVRRRRANEAYRNRCVVPKVKFGGVGVTVCGVQCYKEELSFSLHWKISSTRMVIWIFSGTRPFP